MKIKNIFSLGMSALLGCSILAGCSTGGGGEAQKPLVPVQTVTEPEEHKVSTGIHKGSVKQSSAVFTADGKTDYKLVFPKESDKKTVSAVALLRSHVLTATGAMVPDFEGEESWTSDKKWIVVNDKAIFEAAGLTMPSEDLGQTGFYLVSKGSSVFIAANDGQGILNGVLEFLHHTIGYEMYSADTVAYFTEQDVTMPAFNVIEKPDFEFFVPSNQIDSGAMTGMRFMDSGDVFISVGGERWHNSFKYLHPDDYKDHPEWFALNKSQLCYTARGNEEYLNAMLDQFMRKMIAAAEAEPNVKNITITIQDTPNMCECDACKAEREKYGTDAAAVIKFCNKASERLDRYFEEKAAREGGEARVVNILFFAYLRTTKPPVKLVDGKYEPIDESVVCGEHVGVYIAPIDASYNKSFYQTENQATAEDIKGWGTLSDKLYMWLYETNYAYYLYPLNSYSTMIETYRFCKENNAIFMMNEGQYNQGNVTAFGKLKEYFNSKAMWNVNFDFSEICDNFFANYFHEAAAPMRRYFDELQLHLTYLETEYPELNGGIYVNMEQARFWPKRLIDHWLELIDEGYEAIEIYKTSNPTLYETLRKHLKIESIFPRYVQVTLQTGYYSSEELKARRDSFRNDCQELSITMCSEVKTLETVFAGWD